MNSAPSVKAILVSLGDFIVYHDEVDDPDSIGLKHRRWCLQKEIAALVIQHDPNVA